MNFLFRDTLIYSEKPFLPKAKPRKIKALDSRLRKNAKQISFFAEFKSMKALGEFIHMMRDKNYKIYDVEINRSKDTVGDLVGAVFWVDLNAPADHVQVIADFSSFQEVRYVEELEVL